MRDDRSTYQVNDGTTHLGLKNHSCYNLDTQHEAIVLPSNLLDVSGRSFTKAKKKGKGSSGTDVLETDLGIRNCDFISEVKDAEKQCPSESVENKAPLLETFAERALKETAKAGNTEPEVEDDKKLNCNSKQTKAYQLSLELMELYDFVTMDEQLYLYDEAEGYWRLLRESESNRTIRRMIPVNQRFYVNKQNLAEVYEWLLTDSKEIVQSSETRRYYLNFQDCALDWSTGDIYYERQDMYFKYALRVNYADLSEMRNGRFCDFVTDIFGDDEETKREFRKFLGLCLSDIRDLKLSMLLYGPSNTGKSVLLNLLRKIVGPEWCSSLSFTQMSNEFAITQLLGKRLNLSGEVSGASNKRLDIFKSLTGNDDVTACFKTKDHFQFRNESLLVFACNSFPPVSTLEEFESFLSRIIVFPFSRPKPRSEWINNLDELLMDDLASVIEMATVGLRELEDDSFCFIETPSMQQSKREFIGKYNSFKLFAEECIVEDPDSVVTSNEIREQYKIFCRNEGYVALADNVWSQYLKQQYTCLPRTITRNTDMGESRMRGYQGIRLCNSLKLETDAEGTQWMEDLLCY